MESLNAANAANHDLDDSGCVQDGSEGDNGSRGYPQLLDLSDDVLLYILEHLTPRDLKALGHTCPRLGALILDQTLWKKVDARTTPVGPKRLKWMLNHCLSPSTSELQISGYASKFSRCLGIQDLHWPIDTDHDFIRSTFVGTQEGVDVEHFLLRMWYPHLPRYAVSPRWPDKKETETTNAKCEEEKRKAEEAKLKKSRAASGSWCPCGKLDKPPKKQAPVVNLAPEAGSSVQSSSNASPTASRSDILEQIPCSSGPFSSASDQRAGGSGQSSSASVLNAGSSGQSSSGGLKRRDPVDGRYGEARDDIEDFSGIFGKDDFPAKCKGPISSASDQRVSGQSSSASVLNAGSSGQSSSGVLKRTDPVDGRYGEARNDIEDFSGIFGKDDFPAKCKGPISSASDQRGSGQSSSASVLNAGSSGQSSSGGRKPRAPVDGIYGEARDDTEDFTSIFGEEELRGTCKGPHFSLTRKLMMELRNKCSQLTFLALEYCNLDYKTTNLRHFPRTLKKLSLRGTRCYNLPLNTSYLGKVQERLPALEYLDVSECDWFEPASLMPLSKLPVLTELYMRDCKRLTECVAYASLATRYGFRQLRVFDVRGSPLADSEVSALGWLPRLEELYVAPPEEFYPVTEHTHAWSCTKNVHDELDSWELEEPEYYRIKSPEPELEPEDKDEDESSDRQGDIMFSNPWWSHERRIIVIQPNASRQLEEHYPLMNRQRQQQQMDEGQANQQGYQPRRCFGPIPDIPIIPGELHPFRCVPGGVADQVPRPVPVEPPAPGPVHPKPVPVDPRQDSQLRPGPNAKEGPSTPIRPGISNPEAGTSKPQPGPSNAQAGPSCRPGPSSQPGPSYPQPGPSNPPGPAKAGESASKRRFNISDAIDLAKRRRLEDEDEDELMEAPPVQVEAIPLPPFPPAYNIADRCPRLRLEMERMNDHPEQDPEIPVNAGCVRFRRHDLRPVMHIDVDIHRQSTTSIGAHLGYHLVSDSALLRFGRAENENVNYVHIGRNGIHHGSDSASRPDRSNLRILSVTGYRNITDRSLEHLVTAAPYLLHIDFSETNVTPRGVELFRAVRPECEVIYSEFNRLT